MNKKALCDRWTRELVDRIGELLEKRGGDASDLVGRCVDEATGQQRLDLRGIPLGVERMVGSRAYSIWADLKDADLSYADLSGLTGTALEGCLFRGATLDGNLGPSEGVVSRCDFSRARLRASFCGVLTDCVFAAASLKRSSGLPGTRFVRCDFRDARFHNCDLNHLRFEDCRWEGATIRGGSANWTEWVGSRPGDEQMDDVYILTPEELEREEAAMRKAGLSVPKKSKKRP